MSVSQYSHDIISWGGPQPVQTPSYSVGSGSATTALTTLIPGAYAFSPYPYGVIYDIILHMANFTVGSANVTVDVYNLGVAGGTQNANSYFTTPWTLTANAATGFCYSARGVGGKATGGAVLKTPEFGNVARKDYPAFMNTYGVTFGSPFSVRVAGNSTTVINQMCVTVVMIASDLPFILD